MKVNHPNGIQPHVMPVTDNAQAKKLDPSNDFASVLKEAAGKNQLDHGPAKMAARSIQAPALGSDWAHGIGPGKHATHLLDSLENYQRLLADPSANLRQVQPIVDQMKRLADEAVPLVQDMPADHALRDVIKEALVEINKEIVRFERGEYLDG